MSIRCDTNTDRANFAGAPTGSVTIMFWVRWSALTDQYDAIFWSGDNTAGANAYDASFMIVNGNPANTIEVWIKNSTAPRMGPTSSFALDTWYHIACTYGTANGAACELFVDGASVATGTAGSAAAFQTETTQFGNDANSDNNPNARLLGAKMYNRILTQAEIRAEMWSVMPVNADSLWGCWSLFDDAGGLDDLSGNARPLTESGTLTVESNDCGIVFDAPFTMGGWHTEASAGQTGFPGLTTSANTAFALTRRKTRTVGLSTQASSALAITRRKTRTVGLSTQASAALGLVRRKQKLLGLPTSAATALPLRTGNIIAVGLATETDSVLALTRRKLRAVGLAVSTSVALALQRLKRRTVGLAAQPSTALALVRRKTRVVGLPTSVSSALAIQRRKRKLLGLPEEIDTSLRLVGGAPAVNGDGSFRRRTIFRGVLGLTGR